MPLLWGERYLHRAARACMRRASSPGADRVTWAEYRDGMRERISELSQRLRDGDWVPGPVRLVEIETYTGKKQPAAIPTVQDRIVQRAMREALEPVLEAHAFAPFVSGYRPGRNRLTALRAAMSHVDAGLVAVADLDVAQVSRDVQVEQVIDWLAVYVQDGTFLGYVRRVLAALPEPMIPGTGLWPLLLNLRLSRVDARLGRLALVRFADNYCAFAPDEQAARGAFAAVEAALGCEGLRAHPTKSRVRARANPEDLFLIGG